MAFSDQSTGDPTSWAWAFGDGGSSSVQHPSYTFVQTGTYTVTLTISNEYCSDTMIDTNCITVGESEQKVYLPLILKGSQ